MKIKDVYHYFVGKFRYFVYYPPILNKLIRGRIKKQIDFRIAVMEEECYNQGSCIKCGCTTTALQMANKACDKPCYPPMMKKKDWERFISEKPVKLDGVFWIMNIRYVNKYAKRVLIFKGDKVVHKKIIKNGELERIL